MLRGDGEFGVVLIERGSEVGGGDTRFDVGTVARVVRAQELPDGGYALATVGIRRIRVTRWLARRSRTRRPRSSTSPNRAPDADDADAARPRARRARRPCASSTASIDPRLPDLPRDRPTTPAQASYEIAALAPIGPLDAQRVLEAATAGDRLALLAELLDDHARVLRARRRARCE